MTNSVSPSHKPMVSTAVAVASDLVLRNHWLPNWLSLRGQRTLFCLVLTCLASIVSNRSNLYASDGPLENAPEKKSDGGPESFLTSQDILVDRVQERVVKLFGAGGALGLENYQSGVLIGNEGLVVTSWTTVLDVSKVRVVLHDGRRIDATTVGVDPSSELALLKIDGAGILGFSLESPNPPYVGQRVLGVSNLFGIATGNEYCSVQRGVIMAISPLTQRRGKTKSLYQGKVFVLDVMSNNPGASGGALVNFKGELVGVLGKEIRDEQAGIWLNYALPLDVIKSSIDRIQKGNTSMEFGGTKTVDKPHRLGDLGLTLIPDVLPKTPAFIDDVKSGSIAATAGIQANDLVLVVNDQRVDSRKSLERILSTLNRADSFEVLVQRGQELIRIQIRP